MEILGFIVELLILMLIVFTPIVCVCKNYSFVKLYLVSVLIIYFMLILGAYWAHFYTGVRLDLMGFDFEGMSDAERGQNVAPEMREEATKLYWSNMGIGWPMKAIIWMVILLPYPLIVWVFGLAYNKFKNRFGVQMGFKFWFVRALKVFLGVAALLFIVELLKQHSVQEALIFACTWSLITTTVFICSRLYQSRKGVECALCNDIPDKSDKNI